MDCDIWRWFSFVRFLYTNKIFLEIYFFELHKLLLVI